MLKTNRLDYARQVARKLQVEDGEIILVRYGTPMSHQLHMARLQTHLVRTKRPNCFIGVVKEFDDLSVLNEADMNRLGWQRIPNFMPEGSKDVLA